MLKSSLRSLDRSVPDGLSGFAHPARAPALRCSGCLSLFGIANGGKVVERSRLLADDKGLT